MATVSLSTLPEDIIVSIYDFLSPRDFAVMRGLCRSWLSTANDNPSLVRRCVARHHCTEHETCLDDLLACARTQAILETPSWRLRKPGFLTGHCKASPIRNEDQEPRLLCLTTYGTVAEWNLISGDVTSVGSFDAFSALDNALFLFELERGRIAFTLASGDWRSPQSVFNAHPGPIAAFDVFESSPDYYIMVIASQDGQISLYHLTRTAPLLPFPGMIGQIHCDVVKLEKAHVMINRVHIAFNGKVLLCETASKDRKMIMYRRDRFGEWTLLESVPDWYSLGQSPHTARMFFDLVYDQDQLWHVSFDKDQLKRASIPVHDAKVALSAMTGPTSYVVITRKGAVRPYALKGSQGWFEDNQLVSAPTRLLVSEAHGDFAVVDETNHLTLFPVVDDRQQFVGTFEWPAPCEWIARWQDTIILDEGGSHVVVKNYKCCQQ